MKDIREYGLKMDSPWEEGGFYNLVPVRESYRHNGNLAVTMLDVDNLEEFAMVTKNGPFALSDPYDPTLALLDTNNCPWAAKLFEDSGVAKPTGHTIRSGYCEYQEYRFDLTKLVTNEEIADYVDAKFKEMGNGSNKIKVVLKEENQPARVTEISNNLSCFQGFVGGLIDMTSVPGMEGKVDVICNDEFLFNGSSPNVMMPECDHIMGGNLIFVGYNPEDGSSISLTDEQIEKVIDYIDKNQVQDMDFHEAFERLQEKKVEAEL